MNLSELQKLYPEFKIPFEKEVAYYITLLFENNSSLQKKYEDFLSLSFVELDPVRYKFKKYDEIMAYFKTMNWDLNNISHDSYLFKSGYFLQEFNNYKPDKFYISIDLKEANWQSFKLGLDIKDSRCFSDWVNQTVDLHPAIANSKSFRQLLFGNTNPKRLQRIQEFMMQQVYNSLHEEEMKEFVVGKKSDELVLELPSHWIHQNMVNLLGSMFDHKEYAFKTTFFTVTEQTNFGEFIRIKEIHCFDKADGSSTIGERKLMSVPGNRFFIHYKTLILNKEIDERDTYFVIDKQLAKFIL